MDLRWGTIVRSSLAFFVARNNRWGQSLFGFNSCRRLRRVRDTGELWSDGGKFGWMRTGGIGQPARR